MVPLFLQAGRLAVDGLADRGLGPIGLHGRHQRRQLVRRHLARPLRQLPKLVSRQAQDLLEGDARLRQPVEGLGRQLHVRQERAQLCIQYRNAPVQAGHTFHEGSWVLEGRRLADEGLHRRDGDGLGTVCHLRLEGLLQAGTLKDLAHHLLLFLVQLFVGQHQEDVPVDGRLLLQRAQPERLQGGLCEPRLVGQLVIPPPLQVVMDDTGLDVVHVLCGPHDVVLSAGDVDARDHRHLEKGRRV
mmetsp:Transcript_18012/g.31999  ORF Transcript_18012/g.31999 Transcript_18012/m.31999 type:complete len:243 (+) Transcript_18012:1387-2115(+)